MVHCNLCSQDGTVVSRDKACKAEKTIFGWAIGGSPQFSSSTPTPTSASTCLKLAPVQENIEFLLHRIWAMEEVPGDSNNPTQDEQLAITHFKDTPPEMLMEDMRSVFLGKNLSMAGKIQENCFSVS